MIELTTVPLSFFLLSCPNLKMKFTPNDLGQINLIFDTFACGPEDINNLS